MKKIAQSQESNANIFLFKREKIQQDVVFI